MIAQISKDNNEREKESKIVGRVGEAADLPCDVDVSSCGNVYFITWTKNVSNEWKRLYLFSDAVEKPLQELANPDRADFFLQKSTGSLKISPLRYEDDGTYKCDVTYVQGKCPSLSYATLFIHAEPSAPAIEKDGKVSQNGSVVGPFYEGASLSLECETVGGKPKPEVTWYKEEEKLDPENDVKVEKNGAFSITSSVSVTLERDDLGRKIECHVNNEATDHPLVTWVEVDLHVGPLTLDVSGPSEPVISGNEVTLICTITGAKPAAEAIWFNRSEALQAKAESRTELMPDGTFSTVSEVDVPVSRHDHMGTFYCKGTNIVLQSKGEAPLLKSLDVQVLFPPAVVIGPTGGIIANVSDSAVIYCTYEANPSNITEVRWYHEDEELDVSTEGKYQPSYQGYPAITIRNIRKGDRGMYSCAVSNVVGSGNSSNDVDINVLYPPTVQASIIPEDVQEGKDISLLCNIVEGNPQNLIRVRWFKNDELLHETTEREISWFGITRNITGNYSCEGENAAGWGERSEDEEVIVQYLPGPAVLEQMDHPAVKNNDVTLRCEVEEPGLPPAHVYRWEKNGTLIATTAEQEFTIIGRVNTTGYYSCSAVNDVGVGPEGHWFLKIHAPPDFIEGLPDIRGFDRDDPFIIMTCKVECDTLCEVKWMKNEVLLENSKLYIIGNRVNPVDVMNNRFQSVSSTIHFNMSAWPGRRLEKDRDVANYTCFSSGNEVGDGVSSTTLFRVQYPPESIMLSETQVDVLEGSIPKEVKCSASSFPPSTFLWKTDDMVVARDDVLTFNDTATRENDGTYICVAKNRLGTVEIPMKLNVLYKPECVITESRYDEGYSILVCTADGNPALINFTWIKDNDTLDDDYEMEFENTRSTIVLPETSERYGMYACVAVNDIGESEPCKKLIEGPAVAGYGDIGDMSVLVIAAIIGGIAILFVFIIIVIIVIMRKRRLQNATSPAKQVPATGGDNLYQNVSGSPADRKQNGPSVSETEGNVMYENMPFHRQGPLPPFTAARMRQSLPADFPHAYQNVTYYRQQEWCPSGSVMYNKDNGHCGHSPAQQITITSSRPGGTRVSEIPPLPFSEHRRPAESQHDAHSKSSTNRQLCPQHGCETGWSRISQIETEGGTMPYRPDSTDEMVYADLYDDVKAGKVPDPRMKPPLPPKGIGKKPKEPPLPPKTKKGGSDSLGI